MSTWCLWGPVDTSVCVPPLLDLPLKTDSAPWKYPEVVGLGPPQGEHTGAPSTYLSICASEIRVAQLRQMVQAVMGVGCNTF